MTLTRGTLTATTEDDLACTCGNTTRSDGFATCLPDGTHVEPTVDGPWDERHYACVDCGAVADVPALIAAATR